MFVDRVTLYVKGGDGGPGNNDVTLPRTRLPGPDGASDRKVPDPAWAHGYVPVSARGVPGRTEFYLEPIQIPVGTTLCRLGDAGEEPVARYDGLAWRRPREG